MLIPDNLVPFSKMDKADPKSFAVCEYENDAEFKDILVHPDEYIEILKKYQGFIAPDCSVYRDMPLAIQITKEQGQTFSQKLKRVLKAEAGGN